MIMCIKIASEVELKKMIMKCEMQGQQEAKPVVKSNSDPYNLPNEQLIFYNNGVCKRA